MSDVDLEDRQATRTGWTYLRHALLEPYTALVMVAAIIYGILSLGLAVPLTVISIELLVVAMVSRLPVFREHVDLRLDRAEQLAAAEARAALLLRMDDEHRCELLELEHMLDAVRARSGPQAARVRAALDELLGFDRLTAAYVRVAIAFRGRRETLSKVSRGALERDVAALEASLGAAPSPGLQAILARRLGIARRRLDRWERSRLELETLAHQLATLAELVHLVHEQPRAALDEADVWPVVDRLVADLEAQRGALAELEVLAQRAEEPDPSVLELGRRPLAALG